MGLAGAQRIFDLMDEQPETDEGYVTLVNARENADGSLVESDERTERLGLEASPSATAPSPTPGCRAMCGSTTWTSAMTPDKIVLHDITLYAKPGQKIAFVGATGAGKTTITNLINRFYDIADGKIRYDGININKIKKADLRRSLGIVLQDTNLFTGTVDGQHPLRQAGRHATRSASRPPSWPAPTTSSAACPRATTRLLTGDGANLSQGQRQLLAIARAAVADPPVMILDEATSSIDTRTEAIVQQGMDALMTGRTVFVIAHRLSTVQQRRRHHGAGSRPHHRAGHPRRADCAKGHVLPAVYRRI